MINWNLPHNTIAKYQRQLIDYEIGRELVLKNGNWNNISISEIVNRLKELFNLEILPDRINKRIKLLQSGKGIWAPAADFAGIPGPRDEKDKNYSAIWALVDIFIPNRKERQYLGLAGNQFHQVRSKVDFRSQVYVIENNEQRYQELKVLNECLTWPVHILFGDVYDKLDWSRNFVNIFDLDLMTHSLPNYTNTICIGKAARLGNNILHISNSIGRNITEKQYDEAVLLFMERLNNYSDYEYKIEIIGQSKFRYQDRMTPMRSLRIVFKKINK